MTVSDWIIGVIGVCLWAWLIRQILSPDGYFARVCLGCQRHFLIPGCPVHDPVRRCRNTSAEAMSPPEGKAS